MYQSNIHLYLFFWLLLEKRGKGFVIVKLKELSKLTTENATTIYKVFITRLILNIHILLCGQFYVILLILEGYNCEILRFIFLSVTTFLMNEAIFSR